MINLRSKGIYLFLFSFVLIFKLVGQVSLSVDNLDRLTPSLFTISNTLPAKDYTLTDENSEQIIDTIIRGNGSDITIQLTEWPNNNIKAVQLDTTESIEFDGMTQTIALPDTSLLDPIDSFSISAWVYLDSLHLTQNQYVSIYRDNLNFLAIHEFGSFITFGLQTNINFNELDSPFDVTQLANKWINIIATYDGSEKKIYIQGNPIDSIVQSGVIASTVGSMPHIGSTNGSAEFIKGNIQKLGLWKKVLSKNSIDSINTNLDLIDSTDLMAYYPLNDDNTSTITDQGAKELHGVAAISTNTILVKPGLIELSTNILESNSASLLVINSNDAGPGSLRDAIGQAISGDTILFSESINGHSITLTGTELSINHNIIIRGNGIDSTIISGENSSRIFSIIDSLTLRDVTLTNGFVNNNGGAISNQGFCKIVNCNLLDNKTNVVQSLNSPLLTTTSSSASGGAIFNDLGATLDAFNCIFKDNSTSNLTKIVDQSFESVIGQSGATTNGFSYGGAITNSTNGSATLVNCQFINNSSYNVSESKTTALGGFGGIAKSTANSTAKGGGIFNQGILYVLNSIFVKNECDATSKAESEAGGFDLNSVKTTESTANSISQGGAIYNDDNGTMFILNSTIAHNVISGDTTTTALPNNIIRVSLMDLEGAGIYNAGTVDLGNNILALNTSDIIKDVNSIGVMSDLGHNFISNVTGIETLFPVSTLKGTLILPIDPIFQDSSVNNYQLKNHSLALNGGNNLLLPADINDINGDGNIAEALPIDITGTSRVLYTTVDIGAYEYFTSETIDSVTLSGPALTYCRDSITLTISEVIDTAQYYIIIDSCIVQNLDILSQDTTIKIAPILSQADIQIYGHLPSDSSICLDGIGTNLSIPHDAALRPTAGITISAWVYADDLTTTSFQEIYRKEDGNDRHLVSFQESGTILSFGLQSTGNTYQELDAPIDRTDFEGKWVHVAAAYDGNFQRIYVNGAIIDSVAMSGTLSSLGTKPAYIGTSGGTTEFFDGKIDDVTLWDRGLSASEIKALMSNKPLYSFGLIFYFDMDSLSNDTIVSSYNKPFKSAILNGISQHMRPDTLLSRGAWEAVSNVINIQYQGGQSIYVDHTATGDNNGCTWHNAYTTISSALTHSINGDTIHIAEGSYIGGTTLMIDQDLVIIGGYSNGGTIRDPMMYKSIIDGDSSHRVMDIIGIHTDVSIYDICISNGFVKSDSAYGGGIFIDSASVLMDQVSIQDNRAIGFDITTFSSSNNIGKSFAFGGGIHNSGGVLTIKRSTIHSNLVSTIDTAKCTCDNVGAAASSFGGGISSTGDLRVLSTIIDNNRAESDAFAMAVVDEFGFATEQAAAISLGGGIHSTGSFQLYNSLISNNYTLSKTKQFTGFGFDNQSSQGGGIYHDSDSEFLDIINSSIVNNTSQTTADPAIIFSVSEGGGAYVDGDNQDTIANTLLWNNKIIDPIEVIAIKSNLDAPVVTIDSSYVQYLHPTGSGNIDDSDSSNYPMFRDTANHDFRLMGTSPLIDKGGVSFLPMDECDDDSDLIELLPLDLSGISRIENDGIDIGCYEVAQLYYPDLTAIYVDSSAKTGLNTGFSWEDAYLSIDSAMMKKTSGDTIYIAEGTYPTDETVDIAHDLLIYGSHPSGGGPMNMTLYPTTILFEATSILQINAPASQVILQSFILDKDGAGVAEMEILNGTVEMEELEVK